MKKPRDIEVVRLASELASMQSRVAFLEERQHLCVSREEYDAAMAERDAAIAASEAKDRIHEEEIAALKEQHRAEMAELEQKHEAELRDRDSKLKDYEEIQALLRTENTDFKTMAEFWRGRHFGASSEKMEDIMNKVVGKLPANAAGMAADILNIVDRLNHAHGKPEDMKLPKPSSMT